MALRFPQLSWWSWRGKNRETTTCASSNGSNSSLDSNSGVREFSSVKMPKKKWKSRDERRIDREFDIVLVPSDGGCLSGSESDDSDWSVGWNEPHGFDFTSDDKTESFAVLVPCYGRGGGGTRGGDVSLANSGNSRNKLLGAIVEPTDGCSAWLDSS
ncbi:hypothetical protein MKW98_012881 [Papaver atlanticum]|uniref:Uncharacterized protein n=1 Tax=Papaver atlanticum TaxID=357466 RepID=A0AAD4SJR8_9MAGN|nr:hypothetical protein MKW98_012881 [Papaver atlanticum]